MMKRKKLARLIKNSNFIYIYKFIGNILALKIKLNLKKDFAIRKNLF